MTWALHCFPGYRRPIVPVRQFGSLFIPSIRRRLTPFHVIAMRKTARLSLGLTCVLFVFSMASPVQAQWFFRRGFARPSRSYSQPQYSQPQYRRQIPGRPQGGDSQAYNRGSMPPSAQSPVGTRKQATPSPRPLVSRKPDVQDTDPAGRSLTSRSAKPGTAGNSAEQVAPGMRRTSAAAGVSSKPPLMPVRMPGEFETQKAIMLSISDWMPHHFDILIEIAEKTSGHVDVLVFYNNLKQLGPVIAALHKADVPGDHLWFAPLEMDTVWMRDFAPRIGETADGPIAVDFFYEGSRPKDDSLPKRWAQACNTTLRTVRWTAQGGNLAFNGKGLGVASERIFKDNKIEFPSQHRPRDPRGEARQMVTREFKRACNLSELVILEPLQNEMTRHIDMFMTFIDPGHVLVGQLDRTRDPVNSAILDRNARRLGQVMVDGKQLRVSRIGFPPRNGKEWSSYTNVIMANDLILIPRFDSDPPALTAAAKETYQRLIPGCTVKTVDLTSMKALQGALHCLSMNLPEFAPMPPKRFPFESFRVQLKTR